ncbi:tryptophan 2,3-dioxygenase family protein [Micavibrio aeruginosavorus]|uniref:Tryptophan 2,3-dioxygenase n=1 Tax=Micavibrio aeruginosavorus EPB TaxID=349215 RepID=M4VG96_9BACT|nr:tryptophan 2,3-dioxygenase family protein [Micavibrio aeruginosavorus]AGH98243.1 Tryptophan 2,3-dioxygenase [Micavibrio aeruginosavorus EPB]
MTQDKTKHWDQYGDYLALDTLLDIQKPWSADKATGAFAHDEMLFIIFHQTYELWFKQILFELDDVQERLGRPVVDDCDMQPIVKHLHRVVEILRLLVRQLDILETMTPQDFTDFRDHLKTASGFQSLQFRLIETRLGLRREDRLLFNQCQYDTGYCPASQTAIHTAEHETTLFDQIDKWLARTPFVDRDDYKFWDSYRAAVHTMLDGREAMARQSIDGELLDRELAAIARNRTKFDSIFNKDADTSSSQSSSWRLSWRALQAALFITVYKTEPALQGPASLLGHIMDIDAAMSQWRYRHALMVQRMVGMNVGTGGSAGYGYLMQTLEKHRIFTDLFALSTYLIPSHARPPLPQTISNQMGYRYGTTG